MGRELCAQRQQHHAVRDHRGAIERDVHAGYCQLGCTTICTALDGEPIRAAAPMALREKEVVEGPGMNIYINATSVYEALNA